MFKQIGKMLLNSSKPEQVAEVVYEAATDEKDQLWYVAGTDAQAYLDLYAEIGLEAFRKQMAQQF